jgi:ATP-binding cassette, subfamily C, bacteriocin exporter
MTFRQYRKLFVPQQELADCGPACLAMIIRYYGGEESLARLRMLSGTSAHGSNLLGMQEAARQLGMKAEGFQAEVGQLDGLKDPVILHVVLDGRRNHFVVLFGRKEDKYIIGDPGRGVLEWSEEELAKNWQTSVLMQLSPGEGFVTSSQHRQKKKALLWQMIRPDLSILVVALFIGGVITLLSFSVAWFNQRLIDDFLPQQKHKALAMGFLALAIFLLMQAAIGYLRGLFLARQRKDFNNRLLGSFLNNLLSLPLSFFQSSSSGDIISRLHDARRIQGVISYLFSSFLIDVVLIVLSIGLIAFAYSLEAAGFLLLLWPIFLLVVWFYQDRVVNYSKGVMEHYADAESQYIECVQGMEVIKSAQREYFYSKKAGVKFENYQEELLNLSLLSSRFKWVTESMGVTLVVGVLLIGTWLVMDKQLQVGQLVAMLTISAQIFPATSRILGGNLQIQEARVAFNRLYDYISFPQEQAKKDASKAEPEWSSLEVSKLAFRFPGQWFLFEEVSFSFAKGEIVALVGESGSGKSTFMYLLQGFLEPTNGQLSANGQAYQTIATASKRSHIASVPQRIFLMQGNVLENISLSDTAADKQKALNLCQSLGFSHYIQKFPQGFATVLGPGGVPLSGGQMQLIGLARALYRSPKVLLLDEPTSNIDSETEKFVLQTLLQVKKNCAVLLVTHRTETASIADRIYELKNKRISLLSKAEPVTTYVQSQQRQKEEVPLLD